MRKARLVEVAAAAGVSLSTVDRVLNGRQAVHPDTRARVIDALAALDHPAVRRLGAVPAAPLPRVGVVLHKAGQAFYRDFAAALERAAAGRVRLTLAWSASQSPAEAAGLLRGLAADCDALAATAVNHPEVTAAVQAAAGAGRPVYALLSDFAPGLRRGYLGLDNRKVGRVAGWMVALAARAPGPVAVFVGGHRWHGHDLRETGFRGYLREARPDLPVLDAQVNLETRALTYEATRALLARQPDLRGLYVAGGGMEGAIAALREARRPGAVALVVNELTPDSRAGLADGWVTLAIATPLARLCDALVARVLDPAGEGAGAEDVLPPDLHLPGSL